MSVRQALPMWLLLLLLTTAAGCSRPPPEQRLRESVTALQASIASRDAVAMQTWLAEDFVGPQGLDRQSARRMAQLMYRRHRHVGVRLGPMQVELRDDHATVAFSAVLTGGTGGILAEQGRIYHVTTGWRLEDDAWRMTSAQW